MTDNGVATVSPIADLPLGIYEVIRLQGPRQQERRAASIGRELLDSRRRVRSSAAAGTVQPRIRENTLYEVGARASRCCTSIMEVQASVIAAERLSSLLLEHIGRLLW